MKPAGTTRLLRGLIRHPSALAAAIRVLSPEHFPSSPDRVVLAMLTEFRAAGRAVDLVELYTALEDRGQLAVAGGAARLAELWDEACEPGEVPGLIGRLMAE